jgi:hypothetical protein
MLAIHKQNDKKLEKVLPNKKGRLATCIEIISELMMGKLSPEIFALHYTMHKLSISLINAMAFKLLLHK